MCPWSQDLPPPTHVLQSLSKTKAWERGLSSASKHYVIRHAGFFAFPVVLTVCLHFLGEKHRGDRHSALNQRRAERSYLAWAPFVEQSMHVMNPLKLESYENLRVLIRTLKMSDLNRI